MGCSDHKNVVAGDGFVMVGTGNQPEFVPSGLARRICLATSEFSLV